MTIETQTPEQPADGSAAIEPDWRHDLSDDLRDHPALGSFADVSALAQEHVHLQKLIGRKGVLPPGEDATDEDYARFYAALGRPATPADYELADIERPEGLPWSAETESRMLERMHAAGLTNAQAKALVADYVELQSGIWLEAQGEQSRVLESALGALRTEWGSSFDAQLDMANRAFAMAFGENVDEVRQLRLSDGSFLGDHPHLVRAFAEIGKSMMEAEFAGGGSVDGGLSQLDARTQLSDLENDPASRKALLDRSHPDHKLTVSRRSQLAGLAFGQQKRLPICVCEEEARLLAGVGLEPGS